MDFYTNHCYCTDSNWGGMYDARFMVGITMIPDMDHFDYYRDTKNPHKDWLNLIDTIPYEKFSSSRRLKPHVINWLQKNVKDFSKIKGWCVGTDKYNSNNDFTFNIFFQRRSDAMKFIKTFSEFKKPFTYFDYFRNIRKKYNPVTKTLQKEN